MIGCIDIRDFETAQRVLSLQIASYKVEAELIGFDDLPPLRENAYQLQHSGERFYGYLSGEELVGAISYKRHDGTVDIHRMMVHPDHFRRGIAEALLKHVQRVEQSAEHWVVTTGADNTPAVRLYQKCGFRLVQTFEVEPGVHLARLTV